MCALISLCILSIKVARSLKYHNVLLIRPFCTVPICPRPAKFKQVLAQSSANGQVLKPLTRAGAKYKTAVITLYFCPFIVLGLLSMLKSFFDLYNVINV